MLHDDAALRGVATHAPEFCEKFRAVEKIVQTGAVTDVVFGKLQRRTGFNVAVGADVVGDADRRRTERPALVIPVGINHHQRSREADIDDKTAQRGNLPRVQREFRHRVRADRTVDVIPEIVRAERGDIVHEFFRGQITDVGFADAGADAGNEPVGAAGGQSRQSLLIYSVPAAPHVAHFFKSFDTDQRADISDAAHFFGDRVRDERAVGEKQEIAVGMFLENVEEAVVKQRLAAENTEKARALRFALRDDIIERAGSNLFRRIRLRYPAALAGEVAGVGDRQKQEGRKILAALEALLEFFD